MRLGRTAPGIGTRAIRAAILFLAAMRAAPASWAGGAQQQAPSGPHAVHRPPLPDISDLPQLDAPIVFVSRQIPDQGSTYWSPSQAMAGVGPHSRTRPAAPGRLLRLDPSGDLRVLIDGASPSPATMDLIDVSGPSVSYDGQTIVFAGLPIGLYDPNPGRSIGAWRIFTIRSDGTDLRQVTFSDLDNLNYSQFGPAAAALQGYDDFDPVYLPDGRICFASTRWPAFAQYGGVRTSNLYVVNADGTRPIRLTSERNGAERPEVDPLTGQIVFSRWWRNYRFPVDSMETILVNSGDPSQGYVQHVGLTTDPVAHVGAPGFEQNHWQMIAGNTDGTNLIQWYRQGRVESVNHVYGGSFARDGRFFGNFFPMLNMAEAAGFGGVRELGRGTDVSESIVGITNLNGTLVSDDPISYGVYQGEYAADAAVMGDGRLLVSIAADYMQDYGLWAIAPDGSRQVIFNLPGTSEMRARVLAARHRPPLTRDMYRDYPTEPAPPLLPPTAGGPLYTGGSFIFYSFNVYANGPVDMDISSAAPVGSATSIRFYTDFQRQAVGSYSSLDWPVVVFEGRIEADGHMSDFPAIPANIPLFEQLRGPQPEYRVPLTGGPYPDGAAHVAGLNYSPSGTSVTCIGCHAGHSMIPLPVNPDDLHWSNLAPGAAVAVSSTRDADFNGGLIDRRVMKGEIGRYWSSAPGEQTGQWVELLFPVPVLVRELRLYNPRFGDEANSSIQVHEATVRLFSDAGGQVEVFSSSTGELSVGGTDVRCYDTPTRIVRVELDQVSGTFYGMPTASLAEIEVIAKGSE
ncbi:hypothetical protein RAS1_07090 [Phycisphaerae bacterium RAS1]|nr:hypothetical protein RAS1_07090 [Phycisphaerae bacterium RAS1]